MRTLRLLTRLVDWKRSLLLLPLLAAIAAGVYFLAGRGADATTPRARLLETNAPDGVSVGTRNGHFARDFLAYSPEGETVRLGDLRGTPVIINFWASWCSSCVAELPDLRDLQRELGPDRLRVVAMNAGESSSRAQRFLDELRVDGLQIGMDPTLVVADSYGVRGMPQSVFIDRDGIIRAVYVGQLDEERFAEYVSAAIEGTEGPDRPGPLRFVTTVARERVLAVRTIDDGAVEFSSKSLRCDDVYCATPVVDQLAAADGVLSIERHLDRDPASILVRFDEERVTEDALTTLLAEALRTNEDPLYGGPLQVVDR